MKRTTKRYVVTSDSLNCYLYRVLTAGGDLSQYIKNPILLWMHLRADRNDKNQILALGNAVDLQVEGDTITCYLEFDESDPFAMLIYNKYENGTYNMLSLGAKPLEWSEEPEMMLPGQIGPTITKWKMTDISCVDIGGQDDACACELFADDDKKIALADITGDGLIKLSQLQPKNNPEKNNDSMKLITLTGPALTGIMLALKLNEEATEAEVQKKVSDLVQLSLTQKTELEQITLKATTAETALETFKKEANEAKVIALVDGAVTAKKILPGEKEVYVKLANADYDSTKTILDGKTAAATVADRLNLNANAGDAAELEGLIKLSYNDLWKSGKMERVKELSEDAFLAKRAEQFPVKAEKKR